jgi:hypothetical protein
MKRQKVKPNIVLDVRTQNGQMRIHFERKEMVAGELSSFGS